MQLPKFNPGTWVMFKMDNGGAFGKISGGSLASDEGWVYVVENATTPGSIYTVAEVDISAKFEAENWVEIKQ